MFVTAIYCLEHRCYLPLSWQQIPPGTSSHTRLCMSGRGIERTSSPGHGDHYIHIRVAVPRCFSLVTLLTYYCYIQ